MKKNLECAKNSNERGSALVMAIMATLGVVALSLVFIQREQTEKKLGIKLKADKDVEVAMTKIVATLAKAPNCNATLSGLANVSAAGGAVLPQVATCPSGSTCVNRVGAVTYMQPQTTSWQIEATTPVTYTDARIKSMYYRVISAQRTKAANGGVYPAPAIVRIYVQFEKKIVRTSSGYKTSVTPPIDTTAALPQAYYVDIPVVTADWTAPNTLTTRADIKGCARSPSSTEIYQ